ncbi:nucleotidyltransferase domain-containing protein [Ignavibacteriales bacterium]
MDNETISLIEQYIIKIKQSFNPKYVVLFGSYSRGEQKEFSDIDIAVVFDRYEGENILDDNAFLFRLAWEVDSRIEPVILSLENDNSGFAESVVKNGKILYAA